MTRIALPFAGLLAVLVACADSSPPVSEVASNPVYTDPVVDPWQDDDVGTDAVSVAPEVAVVGAPPVDELDVDSADSSEALPPGRWFALRRGETLAHFARWSELPVEDIAIGPGQTSLDKGELVTSFFFPKPAPRTGDAYLRFIPRTEMDIAVAGAGISLSLDENGKCTSARVALGAVAERVLLVEEAASAYTSLRIM